MPPQDSVPKVKPRLPEWFRVRMPGGPRYMELKHLMRDSQLHTVCEEAHCPNIGECWERGAATFMILGDTCTRRCHYCAVTTGRPGQLDLQEPTRLAETVQRLNLSYCVITSVNRDDLPDGGAFIFAACITKVRAAVPGCKVEVLIPDFAGSISALKKVVDARPEVLNHNIESVRRVFPRVRPKGDYQKSLELLSQAKQLDPGQVTKSGIILGMGESRDEVVETMTDLRQVGCDLLTIGQYLRPSDKHMPVARYYAPEEFNQLREAGLALGFRHVASGPLVRSSYHADEQQAAAASAGV
ncbi:MAG: lipoyl synthase [Dehalococcoidia bacterium]|nr:lipoyl synthase [Dehalococcoidia bacterium]MSQ17699.1 lipoyl synthase [Dehalococcoidia bacterium]